MNNTRTTDLNVIRSQPHRFTWGQVLSIKDIGPYTLVKYERNGDTSYHIYVDGESTSNSATSIEGALLTAIALKHLEPNEARFMAMGAAKLLGVKE